MSAVLAPNIRITGSSTVKSVMPKPGTSRGTPPPPPPAPPPPASCAAIGLSAGSAMRGAIQEAKIGPASAAVGSPTRRA